jgi:ADP-ribose pyrophosphatase YjhB (NUDIX family)
MSHKEKFKTQIGVVLALEQNGSYLLGKRCNTHWQCGNYCLIGGGLEESESLTDAMLREAHEEIGITLNPSDLHFERILHIKSMNLVCVIFKATTWEGTPAVKEPNKCSDLQWFTLDNLPTNICAHDKNILLTLNKLVFSEFID